MNRMKREVLVVAGLVLSLLAVPQSGLGQGTDTLEQQTMSLDVKETDIRDVIRMISKGYDLNIVLDKDVSGNVTVHLTDVPIMEGLQILAQSNGLEVAREGNVYRIRKASGETRSAISYRSGMLTVDVMNMDVIDFIKAISARTAVSIVPDSKIDGKVSGKLYQVPLDDGLRAILEGNGFKVTKRRNIYRVTKIDSEGGSIRARRRMGPPSRVGFHVEYYNGLISLDVSNGNLDDVIKAIADQGDMEVVTYGNLTGEVNAVLNGVPLSEALTLLLGGTKFTFVQKDNVILIGDRNTATPSGQALSKSEIVHLRHIKADEVPKILPKNIPVNNVKVVKEQNALLVSGTSEDIVKTREFLATVDIPTPQVILDAIVVEYSRQLDRDFGLDVGTSHPRKSRHSYFTYPESEVNLRGRDAKALLKWPFNKGTDIVTKIGELTDSFYINLRMLERQQKAKVLAQPSITVLNGNKAQINVGQTQYYTIEGGTADNPTRDFKPISFGIRLDITPWISQSGQITAEISPDISNSMGVNEAGYPNVFRRSIKTTVQIDDGKTLVLGGLLRTEQQETQRKVPILGDIPLLGYLFRSTLKNNIQTNLVIYITPHIIEKGTKMDMAEELQKLDREERGHLFGPSFIDGIDNHLRHVDDEEKDSISPPPLPVEQPETGGRGAEDSNVSESDAELPEQKEVSQRN